MFPMLLVLDTEALALRRNVARYGRPVEFRLDSDGSGVAVSLPSAASLAELLSFPPTVEAYRRGAALLTRPSGSADEPTPVSLPDLAATLRGVLSDLPERPDAGLQYRDVTRAASVPSPRFDAYLLAVVRALRATLNAVPRRPKAPPTAPPRRTETARKRGQRGRSRSIEAISALWWLDAFLNDEDEPVPPGTALTASALHRLACGGLEDLADEPIDEGSDDSPLFRSPRRRVFLVAADVVLGKPRRTEAGVTYTVPEPIEVLLGEPRIEDAPSEELAPIVAALPDAVAGAMASADDPRRALALFGKFWVQRHPDTRESVLAAARAYSPELAAAVRYRVATGIADETPPALKDKTS
ncbi:MAG: hypothetical protein JWP56_3148 [Aeromicrobium sp.]|nr:hypothetical protein [Aeromicrobium sp.]